MWADPTSARWQILPPVLPETFEKDPEDLARRVRSIMVDEFQVPAASLARLPPLLLIPTLIIPIPDP